MHGKQTMGQVAKATGVPQSIISDLERDHELDAEHPATPRKVAYQTVAVLARHYGVSADYLLGLTDDPHRRSAAVDSLGLTPEAVRQLRQVRHFAEMEEEPDGDMHRMQQVLNRFLSSRRFSKFLAFFMLSEKAAEKTRAAQRGLQAQRRAKREGQPLVPVSLADRNSYAYRKYLCLREFEKMLDAFCGADDLEP